MEIFTEDKSCKYCQEKLLISVEEGLECLECESNVHLKCLKRGSVPGGLHGDTFFNFTCQECSSSEIEVFTRIKLSWLQVIVLVLYHLQNKSPGLAQKGFFHWRHHIGKFIDKHWEILFSLEAKKKKKWTGTIAGSLSHFSNYIFLSGTSLFNKPAFWTLMYPKLTPFAISSIYSVMMIEKQQMKNKKQTLIPDADLFHATVHNCIKNEECLQVFTDTQMYYESKKDCDNNDPVIEKEWKQKSLNKRKNVFPQIDVVSKKLLKYINADSITDDLPLSSMTVDFLDKPQTTAPDVSKNEDAKAIEFVKLLDPMCHYNTSFNNISRMKGLSLQAKLTGGVRQELILSPYSAIYLKPYIRRDVETFPTWLKLMAEIKTKVNEKNKDYVLPPRGPIDYTYVQPEHIPAINSICNQFFWPGIDLTETLQYPDFSCVVLYRRLIIGFAFLVPDVNYTENYMSFIFTRPYWRNCGIAKFMIYHLIQTCLGKDITLHVSINNPALLLYQKFGFKVENVVLGFYDKYLRDEVKESKHAFFCRLER
ncbi:hypothetical protein JTB14_016280 [Gonioctena quinquepunctata]|nr:hypothetical protein JTB14_016280 [Gonioctena quinquepunctata]